MFQPCQYGRVDSCQMLLLPMPVLAREIQIQHTPWIHDDDFQAQRESKVVANKWGGSLGREGMGKERRGRQSSMYRYSALVTRRGL